MKALCLFCLIVFFVSCGTKGPVDELNVFIESDFPELENALSQLETAIVPMGLKLNRLASEDEGAHITILSPTTENNRGNDGYRIESGWNNYEISSESSRGLMYGILNIAEQLTTEPDFDAITEQELTAHYPFRAIKFNLPWYSYRQGEHLEVHKETCRDLKYWERFLDMMQENKFNTLTLWGLHPYMYMVKSESFPDASPFSDKELADWNSFWKSLFKMAKERGIDPYIVNWNIFVPEEFSKHYGAADYGSSFWGEGETNAQIEKYTREVVTATINEYEDLTGIGLTLGERMGGMTSEERKDWIDRTIIAGLKNADRKARLIYRAPLSAGLSSEGTTSVSTEQITRKAIENMGLDDETWIEFKYNWSHGHSSPKVSIVHGGILTDTYWDPLPDKYKGIWTVRNEDFFVLRWAQTDFIRAFIKNNSQAYIGGCIIGSECYIPAYDYISKPQFKQWDYAFERQWLFYKVWGNLLYDPTLEDDWFAHALETEFGDVDGQLLLKAWKLASMNANRMASFYQGTWDATLYTEGFLGWHKDRNSSFIDINSFIHKNVLDSSYINIFDFVHKSDSVGDRITPLQLADLMEKESLEAIAIAEEIDRDSESIKLTIELCDIRAWGWFGLYVSNKLRAGVALETYRQTNNIHQQKNAVIYLKKCYDNWLKLTEEVEKYNLQVIPYQFDAHFSWRKHLVDVEKDIQIARLNVLDD